MYDISSQLAVELRAVGIFLKRSEISHKNAGKGMLPGH